MLRLSIMMSAMSIGSFMPEMSVAEPSSEPRTVPSGSPAMLLSGLMLNSSSASRSVSSLPSASVPSTCSFCAPLVIRKSSIVIRFGVYSIRFEEMFQRCLPVMIWDEDLKRRPMRSSLSSSVRERSDCTSNTAFRSDVLLLMLALTSILSSATRAAMSLDGMENPGR